MYPLIILLLLCSCSRKETVMEKPQKIVEVALVKEERAPIWLYTVGNVFPMITVKVTPQIGGKIIEIPVKEGQYVQKGDVLYKIDPAPYEAALLQARGSLAKEEANLMYQESRLERNKPLVPEDYISKLQYDELVSSVAQAKGAVENAMGNLKQAEINLGYTTITSPIDGKISQYKIEYGNVVTQNDTNALTIIRQISPVQLQFTFSQKDFESLQKHATSEPFPLEMKLLQDGEYKYKAEVFFFDNTIDTDTGTILFKGVYANENEELWPGAFVRVRLLLKSIDNALLVPLESVQKGQNGFSVFVLNEDQTVDLRPVTIGPQEEGLYIIENGLKKGEKVVTKGQLNLRPGDSVVVKGAK